MPTSSDGGFILPDGDLRDGWDGVEVASAAEPTSTPVPVVVAHGPYGSGTGTLPALGAAVPWTRAGATPWGNDGRFDLLLLGSDAGADRWSRRMDVMLLVEIDVATGKVAMIGLPRNLINAPFPPGAARDAVKCGCLTGLLNEMYVEATVRHPSRWPGTGAVKGIGAVRSMVMELTGRPVDGVLVADLWGVIKVVDAMGGLDINVPAPVHDSHYPDPVLGNIVLDIRAGQQHLDGRLALAYARSRHQDSDYGRMGRQQTFLLALRKQIGPATIFNAPALFDAAKGFTWTDLPREALPALGDLFDKAAHASVKQLRIVPTRYSTILTPGEVIRIRADIAALLGVLPPPTPSPTPSPIPTAVPTDTPIPTPTVSASGSASASP
jgi:LCP family protein required for cell wall assembly